MVDKNTNISFLRVEPIWLSLKANEDGWSKVKQEIDKRFENCNRLMIENLGAGSGFNRFLNSLKTKYQIEMIRVYTEPSICLKRVRNRSSKDHIPVSDTEVEKYNEFASQVIFDWSFEIDNNGPATDAELLAYFENL